ncbi:hypothetical protein CC78DRAFT_349578 [Lojkania enalia]|uniref:Uncharacterized protein n=1 Tax=Lojkania enalia TaxID=147567 RepID=A0A9P4MXM9_9PLEO|nr:hypothetical protein CC78DRAFT_349578 [Didymosphaeria enalia]
MRVPQMDVRLLRKKHGLVTAPHLGLAPARSPSLRRTQAIPSSRRYIEGPGPSVLFRAPFATCALRPVPQISPVPFPRAFYLFVSRPAAPPSFPAVARQSAHRRFERWPPLCYILVSSDSHYT